MDIHEELNFEKQKQFYFDNFVFIHINKTGGSSIEKALSLPFEHKTALEKIDELGMAKWNEKFKFAVVRNPWDKVVSHYHYRVQSNQTNLGANQIGFREWVHLTYATHDPFYFDNYRMFMPQSRWISDIHGKVLVDFVCHFENLATDFSKVCEIIGKKVDLPHIKASKRSDYHDYYNDKYTIEVVAAWFDEDIENFGYQF